MYHYITLARREERATIVQVLTSNGHKDLAENNKEIIMAITQAMCTSFKKELLEGVHNFKNSGGSTFNIALYTSSATLGASTFLFAYTALLMKYLALTTPQKGHQALTRVDPSTSGTTALTDFADASFSNATITANGADI